MLKQQLQIKLSQKLSPQQIQLMKMIQLSTLELEQKIEAEIGENPALEIGKQELANDSPELDNRNESLESSEIDIDRYISNAETPYYKLYTNNYGNDREDNAIPFSGGISFHQFLSQQIGNLILPEEEIQIAEFIIGSIDDSGYLRRNNEELIDDLAFTQNIIADNKLIEKIVISVQSLEPTGVGARSLRECLLLQLLKKKKDRPELETAIEIIKVYFDLFSLKHYKKLQEKLSINKEHLKKALDIISKLNPKPGGLSSINQNNQIVPDFILTVDEGKLNVSLNQRNAPELRVSNEYKEMLLGYSKSNSKLNSEEEAIQFIKQKLDSAQWFIDAIKQRHQTLSLTINAIIEIQKEYFITGDEKKLRPMILKDIADKINMDISTISRVANSKYIETPYGTNCSKLFFRRFKKRRWRRCFIY